MSFDFKTSSGYKAKNQHCLKKLNGDFRPCSLSNLPRSLKSRYVNTKSGNIFKGKVNGFKVKRI